MKIAICYSGFLKNIKLTYENIQSNLIQDHDVDYFIHTWEDDNNLDNYNWAINKLKPVFSSYEAKKNFEVNPYSFINSKITPDQYKKQLKESGEDKIYFEPPSKDNGYTFYENLEVVKFRYYSAYPNKFLSQFYSSFMSNSLRKLSGKNYDLVIRLRSDLQFNQKLNYSDFDFDKVNVIKSGGHIGQNSINDHFAISKPELMNVYYDLFLYIPTYYFIYNIDFIQEIYLANHLIINDIEVKEHYINSILRRDN